MPQVGGGGRRGCLPLRVRPDPADDDTSTGHRLPGVVVSLWKRAQRIDFTVQAQSVVHSCKHAVNKHPTLTSAALLKSIKHENIK